HLARGRQFLRVRLQPNLRLTLAELPTLWPPQAHVLRLLNCHCNVEWDNRIDSVQLRSVTRLAGDSLRYMNQEIYGYRVLPRVYVVKYIQ
ncbi:hypothetical protein CONPUDRAFT_83899, partial [Coniophora puteana RWD-64-598 SS2]